MKKFAAVLIISLASAGISFAGGGCSSSKSYTMANSSKALKGDVVLMAEGKRVIKHNGKLGQIFFTIQTDAGETLAQEISREEFGIQFPELSKQIQSWAISLLVGSLDTSHHRSADLLKSRLATDSRLRTSVSDPRKYQPTPAFQQFVANKPKHVIHTFPNVIFQNILTNTSK